MVPVKQRLSAGKKKSGGAAVVSQQTKRQKVK
jgi:hypothetical protein